MVSGPRRRSPTANLTHLGQNTDEPVTSAGEKIVFPGLSNHADEHLGDDATGTAPKTQSRSIGTVTKYDQIFRLMGSGSSIRR